MIRIRMGKKEESKHIIRGGMQAYDGMIEVFEKLGKESYSIDEIITLIEIGKQELLNVFGKNLD